MNICKEKLTFNNSKIENFYNNKTLFSQDYVIIIVSIIICILLFSILIIIYCKNYDSDILLNIGGSMSSHSGSLLGTKYDYRVRRIEL